MKKIITIIAILILTICNLSWAGMTFNDLTVNFDDLDKDTLLEDWEWLITKNKLPILITASGDAFVQDVNDMSIYFLDTIDGQITKVADSTDEFQELLINQEFVVNHFSVQMVGELKRQGKTLSKGQVYSFKKPLVLGGEYELTNIELTDIEVHFSISGQIHNQVHALPDGSEIGDVSINR